MSTLIKKSIMPIIIILCFLVAFFSFFRSKRLSDELRLVKEDKISLIKNDKESLNKMEQLNLKISEQQRVIEAKNTLYAKLAAELHKEQGRIK